MGNAIPVVCPADHAGQPHPPVREASQADGAEHLQREVLLRGEHVQVRSHPRLRVRGARRVVQVRNISGQRS